jgi:hypothetical protein
MRQFSLNMLSPRNCSSIGSKLYDKIKSNYILILSKIISALPNSGNDFFPRPITTFITALFQLGVALFINCIGFVDWIVGMLDKDASIDSF